MRKDVLADEADCERVIVTDKSELFEILVGVVLLRKEHSFLKSE